MPVRPDLSRLTPSQLHELSGRDRRWIKQRLAERGVQPVEVTARERRYPARAALEAIYDQEGLDPSQEQARLSRARAEIAEHDLAMKRGEIILFSDATLVLTAVCSMVQQRMLGLPTKLAAEVAAESKTAVCREIIADAIHEALTLLADALADPKGAFGDPERVMPPEPDEEAE